MSHNIKDNTPATAAIMSMTGEGLPLARTRLRATPSTGNRGRLAVCILLALTGTLFSQQPVHRFLLVAGANNGGKDRPTLRYAVSDAKAFSNVLEEMGGIQPDQMVFLNEPGVKQFRLGFQDLEKKLSAPHVRDGRREVVVYYSGHADEKGLRLGSDIMSWPELRKNVDALGADVKIAVIDACGSGAITRLKGGVARPAFLSDVSSDMKGYAFLTSSSENEVSQESDRIKGSFFTHALVSGLRGAADMSGDGKVTLSESYQFAFNETLRKTQASSGGAQHPSRDMNLAGTGDVVMTDLRQTGAGLVLDPNLEGRFFIRDQKGHLVAELFKNQGQNMELGLPPGTYQVQQEQQMLRQADNITLLEGKRIELKNQDFRNVRKEQTQYRGSVPGKETPYTTRMNAFYNPVSEPMRGMQLSLLVNDAKAPLSGTQLALVTNIAREEMSGVQITTGINIALGGSDVSQVSAGANFANTLRGVQLSSGFNLADTLDGFQISSGMNITGAPFQGFQISSINIAKDGGQGTQAGVINVSGDTLHEYQIGVINVANRVDRHQLGVTNVALHAGAVQSGVINHANSVNAYQIGIVNTAGTVGKRQIGIINVARHSEQTPVGLLNLTGNGILDVTSYLDETRSAGWTLRVGTAWMYTLLEHSRPMNLKDDGPQTMGIGAGTRFGMRKHYWNLDYTFSNVYNRNPDRVQLGADFSDKKSNYGHKVRLGLGYALLPWAALTAGISANVVTQGYAEDLWLAPGGDYHWHWVFGEDHKTRIWPGLYAGLTLGRF